MAESDIQQQIQSAAMYHGCHLMRNNSGQLKNQNGTPVRYGLGNVSKKHSDKIKSSDLIGFTCVVITPEMVGRKVAIFTAIEVKDEDWVFRSEKMDTREKAQWAFLKWIRSNGGYAGFASSTTNFQQWLSWFWNDV